MFHPTPHQWTTEEGLTHVFYDNHMPPSSGFGWSSLCDAVRVPIEGEHFELTQEVTEEHITCEMCEDRVGGPHMDLNRESIASVDGCLVRVERDETGLLVSAERVCRGMLHHALPFEPDSFTGNLNEEVDEVCSECWETYVEHQWSARDEGAELAVEVWDEEGQSKYFTDNIETIQNGQGAALRLTSKHGLKKDIDREQIESIQLTPFRNINY